MAENSKVRYSFGGDEYLVVELGEEMSLQAYFKGMAITSTLKEKKLDGIVEICPSNASYLIGFNPDKIAPDKLVNIMKEIEVQVGDASDFELHTRILDIPVYYNDPWTNEMLMRFRDRHQDPKATDLEYAARVNNLGSVDAFVQAHSGSPWFTSMVGFVAGLPFLFQMVPRERQLEVPKYLRPRTDTHALTIGHGGCFSCIYSVRGAGGYQQFGITPAPIFDPAQKLPDFKDFMIFFNPGDIVKFRSITRAEYDDYRKQVENGTFRFRYTKVNFVLKNFLADPDAYNHQLIAQLEEVTNGRKSA